MCSVMSHWSFKLSLFSGNTFAATTLYPGNNFLEKKEPSLFLSIYNLSMYDPNSKLKTQEKEEREGGRKIPELPCSSIPTFWVGIIFEEALEYLTQAPS